MDSYRIGVVGPPNSGARVLLSGFRKAAVMGCHVCARARQAAAEAAAAEPVCEDESIHDNSRHPCDVFSVVVKEKGPLGIKIVKHKKYRGFVCVKGFVQSPGGEKYGVEKSGKVSPGDLLVAVNRQNLLNMTQQNITNILKSDSEVRVLTFLRTTGTALSSQSPDSAVMSHLSASTDGDEEAFMGCSTWRTFADIGGRKICLELVDIPGEDTDLSLLRSHVPALDGVLLVYSLDTMTSLLMLEKRYARAFPGLLTSIGRVGGIEGFPLVVVGTAGSEAGGSPCAGGARKSAGSQRSMLLGEGNAFAEVWGAPSVVEADLSESHSFDEDIPRHLQDIFRRLIDRIDGMDDPSHFDTPSSSALFGSGGLMSYLPTCFGDCAFADQDPTVDSSIGNGDETPEATSAAAAVRRRKGVRRMRLWPGGQQQGLPSASPAHPSEETSILTGASTKMLKFILSSCE